MAVSPSIFKLESQNKNWNICQAMNITNNLTLVVLVIPFQKYNFHNMVFFWFWFNSLITKCNNTKCHMQLDGHRNFIFKIVEDTNFQKFKNVNFICCFTPSNFKPRWRYSTYQNTMQGPIWSANFSRIDPVVSEKFEISTGTAHFRLPSSPARGTL